MATARDVYNNAIALIDEISPDTGLVDVNTTAEFEARAPYLIDLLQKEVARIGRYTKTSDVVITASTDDPTLAYVSVTMPADLDYLEKAVVLDPPNPYARLVLMVENNALYVARFFGGTIRLTYRAIPTTVDSLDDTLSVDGVSQVAMAYGLARLLVAVEGNDYLVSFLANEYERQKMLIARAKPASFERIVDYYGGI